MNTTIQQVKILDPSSSFHLQTVNIVIEDNIITDIFPVEKHSDSLFLSQGWIDIFSDFSEPGFEYRENLISGSRAAQKGGFKHVFLVPNTLPGISTAAEVANVVNKSKSLAINLYPLGSISEDLKGVSLSGMMEMNQAGAVAFTEGWKSIEDANLSLKALEFVKAFDGILIYLPYLPSLSQDGWMHEGVTSTLLGMAGIPELSETIFIQRELELCKYADSKIHFTGLSSAKSVDLIRRAKQEGLKVSCSATPYHLLWNDQVLNSYNSLYKIMPPIRAEEDRLALIEGVKDGTIDMITSHHRPANWDEKMKEFEYTEWGIAGIEHVLPLLLKSIPDLQIEHMVDLLVYNAQNIFGIPRTVIEVGTNINELTLFDTEKRASDSIETKAFNHVPLSEVDRGAIIF